jgi:hypothetical protein
VSKNGFYPLELFPEKETEEFEKMCKGEPNGITDPLDDYKEEI